MNRAIRLAQNRSHDWGHNVAFLGGTRGKIIAEGVEAVKRMMDVSAHVERIAIRNACLALRTLDLSGCVLPPPPSFVSCVRTRCVKRVSAKWSLDG
jgi:tRNA(Arg) A34 adenosine deaminase TadA